MVALRIFNQQRNTCLDAGLQCSN